MSYTQHHEELVYICEAYLDGKYSKTEFLVHLDCLLTKSDTSEETVRYIAEILSNA